MITAITQETNGKSLENSPAIFNYLNYREFLKDTYEFKKQTNSKYSYAVFSMRAGIRSPNYLKLVMEGARNLTNENVLKFAKALSFNDIETVYWENLVDFNQAKNPEEKKYYFIKLKHSPIPQGKGAKIREIWDEWDYYSTWYHAAVRELVLLPTFLDDAQVIVRLLRNRITLEQAKESLELLIRMKFLVRNESGKLQQAQREVRYFNGVDLKNIAIQKFHQSTTALALDSLEKDSPKERDFSGLTIALTSEALNELKTKITHFRKDLNSQYSALKQAEQVYQINFQVVPLSEGVNK